MAARRYATAIAVAATALLAASGIVAEEKLPPQITNLLEADTECIDRDASHLKDFYDTAQLSENHTLYLVPCYTGA